MVFEFILLLSSCAPNVSSNTMAAVVSAESDFNPYAIGVVGGHLSRQPVNLAEAVETVNQLENRGFNYSVGLAQINKVNFERHNLGEQSMFDPCKNLKAGASILEKCFVTSKANETEQALKEALSCYYSGGHNSTKYRQYVNRVFSRSHIDLKKLKVNVAHRSNDGLPSIEIRRTKKKSHPKQINAGQNKGRSKKKQTSMVSYSAESDVTETSGYTVINLGDSARIRLQ